MVTVAGRPNELSSKPFIPEIKRGLSLTIAAMRNQEDLMPRLGIVSNNPDHGPSTKYIERKIHTAKEVGMSVLTRNDAYPHSAEENIDAMNQAADIHGFIVQLPILSSVYHGKVADDEETSAVVNKIHSAKDVDGLGKEAQYGPATPNAILRLMDAYSIDYWHRPTVILGKGRLVGAPIVDRLTAAHAPVRAFDKKDEDYDPYEVRNALNNAEIIITATGSQAAITPDMFDSPHSRVLVDAGAAESGGVIRGDVSDNMREFANAHNWLITPRIGGVGPLTVLTLLENTVEAARQKLVKAKVPGVIPGQRRSEIVVRSHVGRQPQSLNIPSVEPASDHPRLYSEGMDLGFREMAGEVI